MLFGVLSDAGTMHSACADGFVDKMSVPEPVLVT